jgi:hypothetical protein
VKALRRSYVILGTAARRHPAPCACAMVSYQCDCKALVHQCLAKVDVTDQSVNCRSPIIVALLG